MFRIIYGESYFPVLKVVANETLHPSEEVTEDFEVKSEIRRTEDDGMYIVMLTVKEDSEETAYNFEFVVMGTFHTERHIEEVDPEEEAAAVALNGAQILYGQVREQFALMTSRSVFSTRFLPSYYFSPDDFIMYGDTETEEAAK